MILVDSNVLIDLVSDDPVWADWSEAMVRELGQAELLCINPVIYAEIAASFDRIEDLDAALPERLYRREELTWAAGFLASKAHLAYRKAGGTRTSLLPDFLIGAHAAVEGWKLLTRDPRRHRQHFPTVELITPAPA